MMRIAVFLWLIAVSLAAGTLFHTSYQVNDLRRELAHINQEIANEQIAIRVLRAEWAYLNNPDRLRTMTRDLTTLRVVEPGQMIASVAELPVPLPSMDDGGAPAIVPDGFPMAGLRMPTHKPPASTVIPCSTRAPGRKRAPAPHAPPMRSRAPTTSATRPAPAPIRSRPAPA